MPTALAFASYFQRNNETDEQKKRKLYPPSFPDSDVQDLLQSSSSLFLELETVHKPPQVGDEALLLVRTYDVGEEERAGGRVGL